MKAIVLKPDHLGDFAVALPALWEASRLMADRRDLCVLTSAANREWSEILPWLPNVQAIYYPKYAHDRRDRWRKLAGAFRDVWKLRGFDWGIELTSWDAAPWGKLLLRAAGARRIRGAAVRGQRWLVHEAVTARGGKGHQSVRLAERFPSAWGIRGTAAPVEFMPAQWRWNSVSHKGAILIAPFAGQPFKEWPVENWRELRKRVVNPWRLLAPGDRMDDAAAWRQAVDPAAELCKVSAISESLRALADCALAISVDTAAAHYAWLVGAPLVELFSSSADPEQWASLAPGEVITAEQNQSAARSTLGEKLGAGSALMEHVTVDKVRNAVHSRLLSGLLGLL